MSIADLRRDYRARALTEAEADPDPIVQFRRWLDDAIRAELLDATAMTLATTAADGAPDARIVLLKDVAGDGFTFFTNYDSAKAAQIDRDPRASLVWFWAELERQVRVTGTVSRATAGGQRRLFRVAAARQPARGVGLTAEPGDFRTRRAGLGRRRELPHDSPAASCRGPRTGAATSWRRRSSSSGRAGPIVCTIGCGIAGRLATPPGRSSASRPRLSPGLSRRHSNALQFLSGTQCLHHPQMSP